MKKIFILLLSAGLLASCDNFLNLPKEHEPSSNNYFKTQEDLENLVTGAYQPLRSVYGWNNFICGEMRSDNAHYEYYPKFGGDESGHREEVCNFMDGNVNNYSNGLFNNTFNGVSKANVVISRMHDGIPEPARSRILAEARFLRGLYYYNLVRFFGSVPLHLQEVTSTDEAAKGLAPVADIFAAIEADLVNAVENLPKVSGFPQSGSATKGAAETLLASVYLYQKKYDLAIPLLNAVTKEGYGLLNEYADVFKTSNKNSKESIFEVQFKEGPEGHYSNYLYYFLPKALNNKAIIGLDNSNTIKHGGLNVPTPDLLKSYEAGDKRLAASIGVVEGHMDGDDFVSDRVVSPVSYQSREGTPFRYMCIKYMNPHSVLNQCGDDWPVLRYSDVLLMLAECYNESTTARDAGKSLTYLKEVRTRAGLLTAEVADQETLRTMIAHERRVELAFENHRWHDLVRTGKAIEVMNAHGVEMKKQFNYLPASAYNVTADKLVFPIPYREGIWNPAL